MPSKFHCRRDSGSGFEKKYCRKECRVKLPRQKLLIPTTRVRIRSTQHDDKGSHASASVRDWKLSHGPSSRYFSCSASLQVIVGVANADAVAFVFRNHRGVKMVGFGRNCNSEVLLRSTWFESRIGIGRSQKREQAPPDVRTAVSRCTGLQFLHVSV